MNKIKIGINGFGRIGRILLRIISQRKDMEVVAINNPRLSSDYALYEFSHDTIHGRFNGTCTAKDNYLIINDKKIKILCETEPKNIDWKSVGAEYIFDATGVFKTKESLSGHLLGGAKKVIITAPADAETPMFVYGVNSDKYSKDMTVVSCASCTTNCLAPLAKIIDDNFGIQEALMTTIHSATSSQKVVDSSSKKDYRGGRAASYNIIPSSTGAAKAVGKIVPKLNGILTGMSFRVPTLNVSVVDLTCKLKKPTTYEQIIRTMINAEKGHYKGIVLTTSEPVVSSDFIGEPCTCIFDINAGIMLSPTFVKLVAWYDNEYGYSTQLVNFVAHMYQVDNK